MSMIWRWVISLLVWLSADHDRIATEPARAAAAVSAARASIIEEMAAKPAPVPVRPARAADMKTPLFDVHCKSCKQCSSLLDENGVEQGLCVDGFRLWQQDYRNALKPCASGSCPPRR